MFFPSTWLTGARTPTRCRPRRGKALRCRRRASGLVTLFWFTRRIVRRCHGCVAGATWCWYEVPWRRWLRLRASRSRASRGGFVALLLTSIGLALAAPLIATLLLRFGVPSRPCPDPACEQQDAATLTVVFQLSLPGLVLLLLAAAVWILRRRLGFTPPPGWPASPADWVPPLS